MGPAQPQRYGSLRHQNHQALSLSPSAAALTSTPSPMALPPLPKFYVPLALGKDAMTDGRQLLVKHGSTWTPTPLGLSAVGELEVGQGQEQALYVSGEDVLVAGGIYPLSQGPRLAEVPAGTTMFTRTTSGALLYLEGTALRVRSGVVDAVPLICPDTGRPYEGVVGLASVQELVGVLVRGDDQAAQLHLWDMGKGTRTKVYALPSTDVPLALELETSPALAVVLAALDPHGAVHLNRYLL